jgi:hypothetical protein
MTTSTPPWPGVVPPDLAPFPGGGWEYDEPPPPAVKARAAELVTPLWTRGQNAFKTEQTAGRWITYRAEIVRSGKRGVVAYRLKRKLLPGAAPSTMTTTAPAQRRPAPVAVAPTVTTSPGMRTSAPKIPYAIALPTYVPPVERSPLSLPELRYGAGLKPKPPNPDVVLLQEKLGIKQDGQFGAATRDAVITFQKRVGLAPNLPNAELLKRGFGVVKLATWTALFAVRA